MLDELLPDLSDRRIDGALAELGRRLAPYHDGDRAGWTLRAEGWHAAAVLLAAERDRRRRLYAEMEEAVFPGTVTPARILETSARRRTRRRRSA